MRLRQHPIPLLVPCADCNPCAPGCIHTDDFGTGDEPEVRWKAKPLGGGDDPVFTIDDPTDQLVSADDGSLTLQVTDPIRPFPIFVEAEIHDADGGATATGVTIRRADHDDRISLVRIWGTTDGYELRQGSAVLEAFTAASVSPAVIKLEIVSPLEDVTSVRCYVDDVLAHTEAGVAWELPSRIDLGVIAEGGGKWEYVKMSPCPVPLCGEKLPCGEFNQFPAPIMWTLDATAIGGTVAPWPSVDPTLVELYNCQNMCLKYSRHFTFLAPEYIMAFQNGYCGVLLSNNEGGWVPVMRVSPMPAGDWDAEAAGGALKPHLSCEWYPVIPTTERRLPGYPIANADRPEYVYRYPLETLNFCDTWRGTLPWTEDDNFEEVNYIPSLEPHPFCRLPPCVGPGYCGLASYDGRPMIIMESRWGNILLGNPESRLRLIFWDPDAAPSTDTLIRAEFYSPWVEPGHDFTLADTILTRADTGPFTPIGCEFPETLTLVPNGNLEFARRVSNCDPCSECPEVTTTRGLEVTWEWPDADAEEQWNAERMKFCLTAVCATAPQPDPFLFSPWLFKPTVDCGWELCSSAMRYCSPEDFNATGTVVTNENCEEFLPTPAEPTDKCCRTFDRPYITMGYAHSEGQTTTRFELIVWQPNWARFDGDDVSGPWSTPLVKYFTDQDICDEEGTLEKYLDNSFGTVGPLVDNPYYELPYWPDTISFRRVAMPTDCPDIEVEEPEPDTDPPTEWCPGDPNPPEELCAGVQLNNPSGATVSVTYPSPETDPPTAQYDGINSWAVAEVEMVSDCSPGPVFNWVFSLTLVCSDVTDPFATWELHISGSYEGTPFSYVNEMLDFSCPPLGIQFNLAEDDIGGTFADCNAISFAALVNFYQCPPASPALPSKKKAPPRLPIASAPRIEQKHIQKKTPEDLPCVFRGKSLGIVNACCGKQGDEAFQCKCPEINAKKIRACTINSIGADQVAVCDGCEYRQP